VERGQDSWKVWGLGAFNLHVCFGGGWCGSLESKESNTILFIVSGMWRFAGLLRSSKGRVPQTWQVSPLRQYHPVLQRHSVTLACFSWAACLKPACPPDGTCTWEMWPPFCHQLRYWSQKWAGSRGQYKVEQHSCSFWSVKICKGWKACVYLRVGH